MATISLNSQKRLEYPGILNKNIGFIFEFITFIKI